MDIESTLREFKGRLDPAIAACFDAKLAEVRGEDSLVAEALAHVKELTLAGGKRLRPLFMLYGYVAAGGQDRERLIHASISIELIHMFLLIHDDIIDRDGLRHGVPTLHRRYAEWGTQQLGLQHAEHFGNSIALIVGDMLFAMGNDILFRSGFPHERVFAALSKLQAIVSHTVVGQAKDIYLEYRGEASEAEILSMYENKTARYTVEGPLHLGALLAADNSPLLDTFTRFARPLGTAFQIQDDMLGVFGDAKRTGKPVGSDIEEGKVTILVSSVMNRGGETERAELTRILKLGSALTPADIDRFRAIVISTGALDYAKSVAEKLINEAEQAIEADRTMISEAKDFLRGIAAYLSHREF